MLRASMMCERPRPLGGGCTESVGRGPAATCIRFPEGLGLGASGGLSSDGDSDDEFPAEGDIGAT